MRPGLMTCSAVWCSGGGFREYLAGLLAPPSYDGSSPGVARGYTDADRADRESTEELMFCRPIS